MNFEAKVCEISFEKVKYKLMKVIMASFVKKII